MIIGLTGGIASGKSTVSNMLKDVGIPIVDADVTAREVVEKGEPALGKIIELFGTEILNTEGSLDRKKLGAIVFNDEKKRLTLNDIVHPAIRKRMLEKVEQLKQLGHETIVMDIPLLFESKLTYMVEKIIVVYIDPDLQKARLQKRDQFSEDEALARISAQMPLTEKIALADEVIHNDRSIDETKEQLLTILRKWNCL
ncbi:dephospho-CoA kinase [Anaerobacillus isosaccharinicus]|uniref:Dephospho-CoA kinase n=1 Tax=Anaerobacillus isosaccharinicus TaxID=1532552 RepID=A0A1S2MEJ7_9BACI|nr:dephospho-CoA kinase [Anaerobacillus isosaccharinicus]MBA5587919.1 dephospho-CoA kinase [Anaerobacillus isosaccharinicus]QOY33931.1 dephospho-CoA kinase [Anaerobacillus isosaccharinicus]